jgi:DnaK suppressor protein
MTDTRYEELRRMFEARRVDIQRDLNTKLRDTRATENAGRAAGGLDAADTSAADLQQDLGVALIEMRAEALRRIDDAMVRLSSGAYGCCVECACEIPRKRLEALPFAVRCRDCEAASENTRRSRLLAERQIGSTSWIDTTPRE